MQTKSGDCGVDVCTYLGECGALPKRVQTIGKLRGNKRRLQEKSWNVMGKSKIGDTAVEITVKIAASTPTSEKFVSCAEKRCCRL